MEGAGLEDEGFTWGFRVEGTGLCILVCSEYGMEKWIPTEAPA